MKSLAPPASPPRRERDLAALAAERWDLLIVGGGISGTAVARDAGLRGFKTALVEQADFAFGTSSRSSRLIHGGLRYLESLDFGLVREGLVERRRLLDAAPGLVHSVEFLYPVYRGDPDPLWKIHFGVTLYELLAAGYGLGGRRRLSARRVRAEAPQLRSTGLRGGIVYRDAATHDTRLTLAVALSARQAGVTLLSRCRALELTRDGGRVTGATIEDTIGGAAFPVSARAVILCCGPWQNLYGETPMSLRTARGTHLSVSARRLELPFFVALRSPRDDRLAFAMPLGRHTVIGTTDDYDSTEPGSVHATPEDTAYLLELANHAFPGNDLVAADVDGVWAGLRPLVSEEPGSAADEISRDHKVVAGAPGLWVLAGGKLTTHRAMAEDCLDAVQPTLETGGRRYGPCRTHERSLLRGSVAAGRRALGALGIEAEEIDALAGAYGDRLEHFADRLAAAAGRAPAAEWATEVAVDLAVEEEWALSLDDVLLRRVGAGSLDLRAAAAAAPAVARRMTERLGWSAADGARQLRAFLEGVERELGAAGLGLSRPERGAAGA